MMDGDMPALIKTITRLYDENQRLKKVIDDSLDPEKIYKILHDGTVYPCLPNRIMEVVAQELSFELKKELDLGGKDE